MKYQKLPYTSEQHIDLLKQRGLVINDGARALKYLDNISYFRLSGYMFHHQLNDGTHKFIEGITFDKIINEYHFDKKLKLLILEYIERIEVALRAQLSNKFSITYGFYWYNDKSLFEDIRVCEEINNYVVDYFQDPTDIFLKRFKSKYTSETMPPSNMALEILTIGKISRLFAGLKNNIEKQSISNHFGLPDNILASWFTYLTNIRNICAHHSRLWNKSLTANRPIIPTRKKYQFQGELPDRFNSSVYGVISIIERLLRNISPNNKFISKITDLLKTSQHINVELMGFPKNWIEEPAWKFCND